VKENCSLAKSKKECLLSLEDSCIWKELINIELRCRPSGSGCSDASKEKAWDSTTCDLEEECSWDSAEYSGNGSCKEVAVKENCHFAISSKECSQVSGENCVWNGEGTLNGETRTDLRCRPLGLGCSDASSSSGKAWNSASCNGITGCSWDSTEYSGNGSCVDVIKREKCESSTTQKECLLLGEDKCVWNESSTTELKCRSIVEGCSNASEGKAWNSEDCDISPDCYWNAANLLGNGSCVDVIKREKCESSTTQKECLLLGEDKCVWNESSTTKLKCRSIVEGCSNGSEEKAWNSSLCEDDSNCYWDGEEYWGNGSCKAKDNNNNNNDDKSRLSNTSSYLFIYLFVFVCLIKI
jgi:hypothetical protein